MKETTALSVIVPIYNIDSFIGKCAESLFTQTMEDIEFIFVNDCTPDNSIQILHEILDRFEERKKQSRIISMERNSGLAAARNRGIEEAKGEYIIACDGDDWVDSELYLSMYNEAVRSGADMVVCGVTNEYAKTRIIERSNLKETTGKDLMRNLYKSNMKLYSCNKMIRRSLLTQNNIRCWEKLNMWEDVGFISRLFYVTGKVVEIPGPTYHYNRLNANSITSIVKKTHLQQMVDVVSGISAFYEEKEDYQDFKKSVDYLKFICKCNFVGNSFEGYKEYLRIFPDSQKIVAYMNLNKFPYKLRLKYKLARYGLLPLFVLQRKLRSIFK